MNKSYYDKRYYQQNKEERLKKHRTYQKENRVKINERVRKSGSQRKYWLKNKNGPKIRFNTIKAQAKRRDISFGLSYKEFLKIISNLCTYCKTVQTNSGIDRIDSAKGYYMDNATSCCTTCNKAKLQMSVEEYINHCRKVSAAN